MISNLSPGDEWPDYYRGYRLRTNPDGDIWWQVYQGTDRLFLDPTPDTLLEDLRSIKRLGGRVRITEDNDVITRIEDGDDYSDVYVGELTLTGKLVPKDDPSYGIDVHPTGLTPGDVWPSVYDGAKYSFGGDRVWWKHPGTHKRHPVKTALSKDVHTTLQRHKPRGGSFRVTPWNDVVTLVENPPDPSKTQDQLHELPRVVKNIIVMRKKRGVEMLPIYVGSLDDTPIEVREPRSLTSELTPDEQAELDSWAGSLGSTTETNPDDHRFDDDPEDW
ncbi:hypothetical protein [Haloarcula amylovorans]|uniref:hypothetical protein n=1 Tax=Haloarcula amylovorans TaxID=2562280 RepID=UPI00143113E5|nr:hypothetical protein [Halomicroarcula amylolytica]